MAKEISQQTGGKAGDAVIIIPESVKKNLPRDFDVGAIGKIDLKEAETIASEDIFLIKENELVEGLEDFEIIPLDEEDRTAANDVAAARAEERKTALTAEIERIVDRIIKHEGKTGKVPEEKVPEEKEYDLEAVPVIEEKTESDIEYDDGRTWISLEELDKYDEHGHKWVPLEELVTEGEIRKRGETKGKDNKPAAGTSGARSEGETTAGGRNEFLQPREAPVMVEGYVEGDDEYIIWDLPAKSKSDVKKESVPAGIEGTTHSAAEKGSAAGKDKHDITKEDEVVISMEDFDGASKKAGRGGPDLSPIEYADAMQQPDAGVSIIGRPERLKEERVPLQYKDLISEGVLGVTQEAGKVYFIDDITNREEKEDRTIFDESELDKIISGIVQVEEGSAYVLREANVEEDRERIAVISEEFGPSHEDLFVDMDYKYGDEELDYIHTAIVEEDYSGYIREIDEFFGVPGGRTIPAAVELLGLTADEFDTIEDTLFQDEFKDIHLYDRYHLYEFDRSAREGSARESKNCRYLLPEENSLMDFERDSIESDVSSGSALIFEEDIHDITEQLAKRSGKTEDEIRELVERTFGADDLMESPTHETQAVAGDEKAGLTSAAGESAPPAELFDITDRVVILDSEADVDRFVKEFPSGKQMNIKMLLKYLDGLFETLPEEIIKKFASSEYFELYLKVLNELGV